MKATPLIWISVALNLAMAAGVFHLITRPPSAPTPHATRSTASAPVVQAIPSAVTEARPAQPAAQPPSSSFHWSQILSDDLKIYRDNLRAIGCPPLTVRDIILSEINKRFEQQRKSVLAAAQARIWEVAIQGPFAVRSELSGPLDALIAERQKLIDEVLGGEYQLTQKDTSDNDDQDHLSWLPPEKRKQLIALETTRQQALDEWAKSVGRRMDGQLTADDNARLQKLQKDFEDKKKELLTPEELDEIRLRSSRESLWAAGMSGFEPTEDEWRSVTRLRADLEEARTKLAGQGLSDEARRKSEEEMQAELTRATKEALGPEQFARYELANEGQYQDVQRVTQRFGLPDSVAAEAYQTQQAALAQAQKIQENSELSEDKRKTLLLAIRQETERTLARTLGEKVMPAYREYSGDWLKELDPR